MGRTGNIRLPCVAARHEAISRHILVIRKIKDDLKPVARLLAYDCQFACSERTTWTKSVQVVHVSKQLPVKPVCPVLNNGLTKHNPDLEFNHLQP